jgi:cytoskeleton protein RodZ
LNTAEQLSTRDAPPPIGDSERPGARLRAAREAAGLSVDDVAHQLKLAPRQVRALEEESFEQLPGRTFSRGFMRNYARLLNLDAQDLLAQLPQTVQAPLQAPSLRATATTIAELPTGKPAKSGFARWLIPLVLITCVVGAAAYEWYRNGFSIASEPYQRATSPPHKLPAAAVSQLPNPLANSVPIEPATAQASLSAGSNASEAASPNATTAPAETDAPLILTYRGPSWTEVHDGSGQMVVSRLVSQGSVESVRGSAPFELTLGNADAVRVTYLGKPVDLAPFTRQKVAHLTLP